MKKIILKLFNALKYKKDKNAVEKIIYFLFLFLRKVRRSFIKSDNVALSRNYLKLAHCYQRVSGDRYRFVSNEQALRGIEEIIKKLDKRFDLVIGIPRSGLFIANVIALKLGLPLTTPDLFGRKEWISQDIEEEFLNKNFGNILLVDDSIVSGETMNRARDMAKEKCGDNKVFSVALIATKETMSMVDYYWEIIPKPRFFEWNLMHAKKGSIAVDLDGVLCENPPAGISEFDEAYRGWLVNAKPYLIPSFTIDAIISNRLEKHRQETESWLKKYEVKYDRLILCPVGSKRDRKRFMDDHKAKQIIKIKPSIYWESETEEAKLIFKKTKIAVLSFEDKILFN